MAPPWSRFLLLTCLVCGHLLPTAAAEPQQQHQPPKKKPHIVYVLADDLGWNDIGYHNQANEGLLETPHLDQLMREGVNLDHFYTQSVCTPTRAALLTGRYPMHVGLQHSIVQSGHPSALGTAYPTLAEALKARGYATSMVGKWHLGYHQRQFQPLQRGFDTFYGMWTGAEYYFSHVARCEFPYHDFQGPTSGWGIDWFDQDEPVFDEEGQYSTDLLTRRAEEIILQHPADGETPLFLYLPYQAVHGRLEAPPEIVARFAHIEDENRRIYAAMLWNLDEGVGKVKAALEQAGLHSNSVLIFTTDNGGDPHFGGNNWPLRGGKATYWEGGVRGVAFVHSPLLKETGVSRDCLMGAVDWFPTILGLVDGTSGQRSNATDMDGIDGVDQWPCISEGAPSSRTELLHTIDPMGLDTGDPLTGTKQAAIRRGPWKLLLGAPGQNVRQDTWVPPPKWTPGKPRPLAPPCMPCKFTQENLTTGICLFNIDNDPEERCNLAASEPTLVAELVARIEAFNATAVPAHYPPPDDRCDPSVGGRGYFAAWGEEGDVA